MFAAFLLLVIVGTSALAWWLVGARLRLSFQIGNPQADNMRGLSAGGLLNGQVARQSRVASPGECAMCLSEGKIVAARIADHVEPHHNDPIKFWNGKPQEAARTSGSTMRSEAMVGRFDPRQPRLTHP
jgi:hypothetical protein